MKEDSFYKKKAITRVIAEFLQIYIKFEGGCLNVKEFKFLYIYFWLACMTRLFLNIT